MARPFLERKKLEITINKLINGTLIVLLCGFFNTNLAAEEKSVENKKTWILHSNEAAKHKWEDAFVTGNGRLGTMVRGIPGNEVITCVHEELFIRSWDRSVEAVADISHMLPDVRKAIAEGNPNKGVQPAVKEARRQLVEKGVSQAWTMLPHPAFDLRLDVHKHGKDISSYKRSLNLESGEVLVSWSDAKGTVEQRVFSSRVDNVNVIQLKGINKRRLNVKLALKESPGRRGVPMGHDLEKAFSKITATQGPQDLYYYANYSKDRGGYEGVARVEIKGGEIQKEDGHLSVKNAEEILIIMRIDFLDDAKNTKRKSTLAELKDLPADYAKLLSNHAQVHGEMFRRVSFDLGSAQKWNTQVGDLVEQSTKQGVSPLLLEQSFAMGRYLLISTCGKYPAPLQGIWGASWSPMWAGGFTTDTNVNLAISAASMGNLPECAESYFSFVDRQLPGWRKTAKAYLGTRGFMAAINTDPETGYLTHFLPRYPWMYWPGGAGWNIRPFYDYGLLTGDMDFMKKRVLPLYQELSLFYEDYLQMGKDGSYHISPSISPENFTTGGMVVADSTFDIAVAKEVFSILIELGEKFKVDANDIKKWRGILAQLPDYRINKDGALAEWLSPRYRENYNHRHNSHLYPIFPGLEFLKPNVNPALVNASQVALDKRFKSDTDSAHGLIHVALMAARLHDVGKVRISLDRFSRRNYIYKSFMTSHNSKHSIYNLDSILSLPRLMMEMLVFSQPGHIELMPAWPKEYADGTLKGVLIRGGHKMNLTWAKGKLVSMTLFAGVDDQCTIKYGKLQQKMQLQANKVYHFNADLQLR